jgi:hypothetical protein
MASTYTDLLRIEQQADGENSSTWGQKQNNNHELFEDAIAGWADVAFTSSDVTLSTNSGSTDEARKMFIKATGTLSANVNMIVPAATKLYIIWNATSGAYTLTVKTSGGTGIVVPTSSKMILFCDGTNVLAINDLPTLNTAIAIASGGTGATTAAAALTNLGVTGKQMHPVYAAAMRPSATGGCASIATSATSANQPDIDSLDFDASTQEYAQFSVLMPKQWNEGTITAQFVWTHGSTTTNFGVVWNLQGVAIGNNEAIAAAYGTAQQVADTGGTTNNQYFTDETSAITIAGTPQAGDVVHFRVSRVTGDASDTMAVDAKLIGIKLFITTDAANEA